MSLPGWWVTPTGKGAVSVQNPKNLPGVIEGYRKTPLTDAEVDLIRRQLDALCRDVRL